MAPSVVARGHILLASTRGDKTIPEGWALDKLILDTNFHGEKDGHLLIFKRAAA